MLYLGIRSKLGRSSYWSIDHNRRDFAQTPGTLDRYRYGYAAVGHRL